MSDQTFTTCLMNPADATVLERTNMLQSTLLHSTQRGVRNADMVDRYVDAMLLHDAKFASTMENLCVAFATVADDSAMNENQATQQDSDTAKKVVEASVVDAAVTLGNIAQAMAPALVQSGQPLSLLALSLALPAAIKAAQTAAATATA